MTYDPDPAWTQNKFIKSHHGDYLPNRKVDCIYIDRITSYSIVKQGPFKPSKVTEVYKYRLIIEYSNGDAFDWEFDDEEEAIEAREHLANQLNIKS